METFMYFTGFWEIVTRKEAERRKSDYTSLPYPECCSHSGALLYDDACVIV